MTAKSDLVELIYFSAIDKDTLKEDTVASALQSIETALLLIAADKWPSVLTLLWESAEKLLKTIVPGDTRQDNTAMQLINRYATEHSLSEIQKESAHQFRLKRNEFSHHGYSPRHDAVIIKHVFKEAIPFLDHIFQTKFAVSVFKMIGQGLGQSWIADVYERTSMIVDKKTNIGDDNFVAALLPIQLCFDRIARTGHAHQVITETNSLSHLLQEDYQDLSYKLNRELYFQFIADMKEEIKEINYSCLLHIPDMHCLKCSDDKIIGAVTFDGRGRFLRVEAFGCFSCEWKIWDAQVCDVFINQLMDSHQKNALEDNTRPTAEDNPPSSMF